MNDSAPRTDYSRVAIESIEQEHRALAQVIELMRHLMRDIASEYTAPDFHLLSLALYYIDEFPGRLHHSKEDEYIFNALRRCTNAFDAVLERLQSQHAEDHQRICDLHRLLVFYQAGAPGALERFRAAVEHYAAALYDHMRTEEALLQEACERLPQAEWKAISEAFARDRDPLIGPERRREFAILHHRIINLLPRKMRAEALVEETVVEH